MNSKKTLVLLSLLILGLSFTIGVMLYKKSQKDQTQVVIASEEDALVKSYSMTMGPEDAKVILVEFMDPECESCREFSPLVKMIMKEFEGKVRLVIRYATFHANAPMMVKILEASRKQDKYWEVLDVLFKYQPQWGSHHAPKPELVWNYLPEAGVNLDQIKADYTPSFYVNGKPLEDFGYEPLRAMIQSELN
jgi:protein-disulfide isomerase